MATTFKEHHCSKCNKRVDNLNRLEQDLHEQECSKQKTLT
jgi:hypothetical protein